MPTRPNKAGSSYKDKPERTYPKHASPEGKSKGKRQSPKTAPPRRDSALGVDHDPVRSKKLADDRRKGR